MTKNNLEEDGHLREGVIKDVRLFHLGKPCYVWLKYQHKSSFGVPLFLFGITQDKKVSLPKIKEFRGYRLDRSFNDEIKRIPSYLKEVFDNADENYQPSKYSLDGAITDSELTPSPYLRPCQIEINPEVTASLERAIEIHNKLIEQRRDLAKKMDELYSPRSLTDICGWRRGLDPIVKPSKEREDVCL